MLVVLSLCGLVACDQFYNQEAERPIYFDPYQLPDVNEPATYLATGAKTSLDSAKAYADWANYYWDRNYNTCDSLAILGLHSYRRSNVANPNVYVGLFYNRIMPALIKSNVDSAERFLDSIDAMSYKMDYSLGNSIACNGRAEVYTHLHKYSDAINQLLRGRRIADSINYIYNDFVTDYQLGQAYLALQNDYMAWKYFIPVFSNYLIPEGGNSSVFIDLFKPLEKIDSIDRAFYYLNISKSIHKDYSKEKLDTMYAPAYAAVYAWQGKYDSADYFAHLFTNSSIYQANLQDMDDVGWNGHMANIYVDKDQYGKALPYLKFAVDGLYAMEFHVQESQMIAKYALALAQIDKNKEAEEWVKKADELATQGTDITKQTESLRYLAETYSKLGDYKKSVNTWKLYHQYNDSLFNISISNVASSITNLEKLEQISDELNIASDQEEAEKQEVLVRFLFGASAIILFSAMAIVIAVFYRRRTASNKELNKQAEILQQQNDELQQQQKVLSTQSEKLEKAAQQITQQSKLSEDILHSLIPPKVALELRDTGKVQAKYFQNVTVLFTDFPGFTSASEKLSANELLDVTGQYFSWFDTICKRYGLTRIKLIGDTYMACAGVPESFDDHEVRTAEAALEMMKVVKELIAQRTVEGKPHFDMRIGINSGPVVAGMVGSRKFAYDIFGDTVNIASRIEKATPPGSIYMTASTAMTLLEQNFKVLNRGSIDAKNRGEIYVYELLGK